MMPSVPPRVRTLGLNKAYAVPVLSDVNFECLPGEVHALIGANGAGKSTLARILCGLVRPDAGSMEFDGRPYAPRHKRDAEAAGVHIVHQELNLVGNLSVAENLFLSDLPRRWGCLRLGELREAARTALARVGLAGLDPATPVAALGVGVRQLVEIAGALARACRLLILDEPTAALSDPQIERLFDHIRRLRASGVSVIYISHRMDEIARIADRTTVLRDGRIVATRPVAALPVAEAVRMMAGRDPSAHAAAPRVPGPIRLRVRDLRRAPAVRGITLEARAGEILGLAGLVGSGRTEFLRAVFGAERADGGEVQVDDSPPRRFSSPAEAVAAGLAMVPEDRKEDGLMLARPVAMNMSLASLASFRRASGLLAAAAERTAVGQTADRVNLRCASLDQPVTELSGGNQQKTLIGRWLMRDAAVYLFDEPTRGVDISAKAAIHELMGDLARRGRACVVASSEPEELMSLCDRIAVFARGRIARVFERGEWTHERILAAAFEDPAGGAQ